MLVNFVSWSVMWPIMFLYRLTLAIWKAIFHFWIDFISKLVRKTLPTIDSGELQHKIHHQVVNLEQKVEPILSTAKFAAVR